MIERAGSLIVITGLISALLLGGRWFGWLQWAELRAYDAFVALRAAEPLDERPIAIVAAGETEIAELGWPLSDAVLTDTLQAILALDPAAVGVDIYRDRPVGDGNERLAKLLQAEDRVFWINKFGDAKGERVPPPAVLRHTEQVGFADMIPDPSGVVRRGLLFLDDGETVEFSLSLRLALKYLERRDVFLQPDAAEPSFVRLGTVTLPPFESGDGGYSHADAQGYQYILDYGYGAPSFDTLRLLDLLQGRAAPNRIKGKIVLVGVAAETVKDAFYTPFTSTTGQTTNGVQLHGEMAHQLIRHALAGEPVTKVLSELQDALWIVFWTALGALIAATIRAPIWFAVSLVGLIAVVTTAAFVAFQSLLWLPLVPPIVGAVLSSGLGTSYVSYREKRDRRQLMGLFSRHVSGAVAEEIWRQRDAFLERGRPVPQNLTATVLFTDIMGFTPVTERLSPSELVEWLNGYFEAMASVINAHGGVIDKFIGDAIMVVFGVPVPSCEDAAVAENARAAATCALAMAKALKAFNLEIQSRGLPPIGMRVGIHTGDVVAGSLGGRERSEYTVIGDTVNTAARLESFAGNLAADGRANAACLIAVSQATMDHLGGGFTASEFGAVELKGKAEKVAVFHLTGVAANGHQT